ncbi:MAG TPA: indolepyruvate ferredoxin oxidoreductase family protein, partial [Burkholderiaceae bacterium]
MNDTAVTLADKYTLERGRVFATCMQALARLPMMQKARDAASGLNTAGFVSGYRGSPLGGLDRALVDAREHLRRSDVRFVPGVNEELAATSVWGTQQLHLFPEPQRDGVFAMWYGKGPGVDRCGDVFKHANHAGTSRHGGVLAIAGDDHAARSSAVAHQSEHVFAACAMPVLAPSNVQDCIDLGLHGWAMSRYSGLWVALKLASEVAESSAVIDVDPARVRIAVPESFALPPDGLHLRWPDSQLAQEQRMQQYKVYAALAYCRENRLNRVTLDSSRARIGIVSCGKAYQDVLQALELLGIDEGVAAEIGLRLLKVGMVWPLEAQGVRDFAEGLEEILVVEEKRPVLEYQIKEELYNWRDDVRPKVIGKFDERGEWSPLPAGDGTLRHAQWLLPPTGELTPAGIARAIARRIARFHRSPQIDERVAFLERKEAELARPHASLQRLPYFCPGCPHNTSTQVPPGGRALGGVGCHLMAAWMNRNTLTFSQMGGEGATWIGASPYSGTRHVFANMGDGTYFHSGILSIRAAVAAGVSITFKLLYNDAVAMTGGQPIDGTLTVPQLTRQLVDEGVARVVVVADDTGKYPPGDAFAPGVPVRPRAELDAVQRELAATEGVTVLVYDQPCAAQTRRGRARGESPTPSRRVFINERVCEGCADCAVVSNCVAVVPVETEFGRKSAIDQAACNLDFSCLAGACPALVTVEGATRRGAGAAAGLELAGLGDAGLGDAGSGDAGPGDAGPGAARRTRS